MSENTVNFELIWNDPAYAHIGTQRITLREVPTLDFWSMNLDIGHDPQTVQDSGKRQ
ncbi:hypothetical protein [Manganibacter manganicus]|uniref:hypothetical protein n=1 Tax=Manganibacter manganicus TaxID=1873176 RepID=UPI001301D050|nr:hypothetical protein [Pseudaminobacter manganicus]